MNSLFKITPKNWHSIPLRYLVSGPKNGAWGSDVGDEELDVICVRVADFDWDRLTLSIKNPTKRSYSKQQFKKLQLRLGDIIIEKSGGGEKSPVGKVVMFDKIVEAVTSNFVARIRSRQSVSNRYMLYLLAAQYLIGFSHQFIKQNTGIQNLDDKNLFRSKVCLPNIITQQAIVDFLDRETKRIDQIVQKKHRLLKLLEEKRNSLITAVVAGQIDDLCEGFRTKNHAKMNVQVRRVVSVKNEKGEFKEDIHVYVGLEHIKSWTGEIYIDEDSKPESQVSHFDKGEILFGKIRPYLAKISAPNFRGVCAVSILVLKPRKNVEVSFLKYALANSNYIDRVNASAYGVTMPIVSWRKIGMEKIWIPNLYTQRAIAEFLDQETSQINQAIERIRISIDRFKEYRSALITHAVTGQIDVSKWARSEADNFQPNLIQSETKT